MRRFFPLLACLLPAGAFAATATEASITVQGSARTEVAPDTVSWQLLFTGAELQADSVRQQAKGVVSELTDALKKAELPATDLVVAPCVQVHAGQDSNWETSVGITVTLHDLKQYDRIAQVIGHTQLKVAALVFSSSTADKLHADALATAVATALASARAMAAAASATVGAPTEIHEVVPEQIVFAREPDHTDDHGLKPETVTVSVTCPLFAKPFDRDGVEQHP